MFYEATVTLIPKLKKDPTKKENFRQISFMNIDAKILKILANQIQEHMKMIIYHAQVSFIPGRQGWFYIQKSINGIHCINKLKEKTHDYFISCCKSIDKIQHLFMLKVLEGSVIQGPYVNIIKAVYYTANQQPTSN